MTRRVVEKLCTKKVCVDFLVPTIPARQQSEDAGPRLLGFVFDAAPHVEYFLQFFEPGTKAASVKAACGTLRF